MKLEPHQEVALIYDILEVGLRQGDVAMLVDYIRHPAGNEEGAVLEIFNAIGESVAVVSVPVSAIASLRADQMPAVRSLSLAAS